MQTAIIYDCEFLTAPGAPTRFWCGPQDPDPVIAQIGLVALGLDGDAPILDTLRLHVVPVDRHGQRYTLDPLFTRLTGITESIIDSDGLPLGQSLDKLAAFAGGAKLWSWGKDEFNMMAISCYVQGLVPPLPAARFGNAADLLLTSGVPLEEVHTLRSDTLAAHFDVAHPLLQGHDALDDARSVAFVLQDRLRRGLLTAEHLM